MERGLNKAPLFLHSYGAQTFDKSNGEENFKKIFIISVKTRNCDKALPGARQKWKVPPSHSLRSLFFLLCFASRN